MPLSVALAGIDYTRRAMDHDSPTNGMRRISQNEHDSHRKKKRMNLMNNGTVHQSSDRHTTFNNTVH